jgi:serine/threonine protein kinase
MNAPTTKVPRHIQMFPGLKAFCRQQSSQPSKLVSVAESTTLLGKLLDGRYQVVQVLGAGGFSQTYLAKDIHKPSNPTCVVKHFKPASSDPSFLRTAQRLFQTEAEILEKLGHNNQIPQLLAYFEEEQNFYLIQEYIDGQTLGAKMQPGYCWLESQVIQLLQEVLDILVFIHTRGVIHRDIKPDNLIQRKQDNKLVLVDFGSVKQIKTQTVTAQGHQSTTIPIGTQGYMAAEQGQGNPRPSSDLYALGIISVQALTGLTPTQFQLDPDTDEICWQQQAKVSSELASLINKLVSYHFKDRYQSAIEALEALQPLTKLQSSNPSRYSFSQLEAPEQQLSTPSILLSQVPSSEPSQKAVFSINSSEQAIDSKNRSWIWAGIGTGLASAVALSTGISSLPDQPVQDASKSNSSEQPSVSKSDSSSRNTPDKGVVTQNNSNSQSSPRIEKLPQTTNIEPFTSGSSSTVLNNSRSASEQPFSLPIARRQIIAATTNPSVEQPQLRVASEQPSSLSIARRQVIAATANPSVEQIKLTRTPANLSTEKLEEIATIAKLSTEKRKLTNASEALLGELELLEAIATTAKSSAEKHKLTNTSKDVSAEQPEVMATTTNLSKEKQEELMTTSVNPATEWQSRVMATRSRPFQEKQEELMTEPVNPPTQEEPESLPDTEALLAKQQEEVAYPAHLSTQELETSPDFADIPAEEQKKVALPFQEKQEELTTTSVNPATEWQSRVMATRSRPFQEKQEELMTEPVNPPTQEEPESLPDTEALLAKQQEEVAHPAHLSTQELETSPDFADIPAKEQEKVALPANLPAKTQHFLASLPEASNTPVVPLSTKSLTFVTVSADNTIKIWNLHTGELLNTYTDHI